jgi:Ca2+-binding EF-hand superfamily protein
VNVHPQDQSSDNQSCQGSTLIMNTFAIVRNTVDILKIDLELDVLKDEERKAYYEAFQAFDWNNNGKISYGSLIFAMRRAGLNPTEVEVHDIINRLDDGSGIITFEDFCKVMLRKNKEIDQETYYKESFRVFYKDEDGCIPAEELKFVLRNLNVSDTLIELFSVIDL